MDYSNRRLPILSYRPAKVYLDTTIYAQDGFYLYHINNSIELTETIADHYGIAQDSQLRYDWQALIRHYMVSTAVGSFAYNCFYLGYRDPKDAFKFSLKFPLGGRVRIFDSFQKFTVCIFKKDPIPFYPNKDLYEDPKGVS